jgi:hypothetical protein
LVFCYHGEWSESIREALVRYPLRVRLKETKEKKKNLAG